MEPLFRRVDCVRIPVPDLEAGLAFYRDALGHELAWRTATAAGLRMAEDGSEIVLYTDGARVELNLLVDSVPDAVARLLAAGCEAVVAEQEIQVGRLAVVLDPWKNPLVLLDLSKGLLRTDGEGNVIGNEPA